MQKFWELLQQSVIVQSIVTLLLISTICFLYAAGREVPVTLVHICEVVLGFWMGTKVEYAVNSRRNG